ncbi:MAG: thiamine diphosphokinase [Thermoplasmatota archaeon]
MKIVVVLAGEPPSPQEARRECAGATVIAADGGANVCAAWGIVPDLVVGDMDSARAEVLDRFAREGAAIERHPRAKLHTDGELAVDRALGMGATELVLLASMGGRLDQTLANFGVIARAAARGIRVRALEATGRLSTVVPVAPLELALPAGTLVSVLALGDRAEGVTLEGFEYALADATLVATDPIGVSNVTKGTTQRVSCARGVLAVIEPDAEPSASL